jgi:hypothetical protein
VAELLCRIQKRSWSSETVVEGEMEEESWKRRRV